LASMRGKVDGVAVVRQFVVPDMKRISFLLGASSSVLGLQANSSTGERCSQKKREPCLGPGYKEKAFGHHKMALESTLRLHNDGCSPPSLGRD